MRAQKRVTMLVFAVAAGAALCSLSIRSSNAATRDSRAVASLSQKGCTTGEKVPDLSALPSGTRVFLQSALAIGYPKPGGAAVLAFYTGTHQGDVRADIRDGAVYVAGRERPVAALDGQPVSAGQPLVLMH